MPRAIVILFFALLCACRPPGTFNPGDPTSEEYFLTQALACLLGSADCATAGGASGDSGSAGASVGGTMVGLVGSVSATLNGTETITISADGSYGFTTVLNPGDSYTVTVDTMPVPQACIAGVSGGTVPDTGSAVVDITCKSIIYVSGQFTDYDGNASSRIVRIETNGTYDSTFNVGTGLTGGAGTVSGLLVSPDGSGKVYAAGNFTSFNGTAANRIVRINVDGSIDTTFNSGTGFNNEVRSLAAAPDGSGDIYAVGNFTTYNGAGHIRIVRINSDGTADTAFATGSGISPGPPDRVVATTDGSNDIYVVGNFTNYNGTGYDNLLRLNDDGSHDGTFNLGAGFNGGQALYAVLSNDGSGDLYVHGTFTQYQGTVQGRVTRINPDGSRDTAFNISPGCNSNVDAVAVANDGSGDVYVAGPFSDCNSAGNTNGMARFNSDGTIDAGFPVTGVSGIEFLRASNDADGDVYIVGSLLNFNGTGVNRLVRVNSDASIDTGFNTGGSGLANTGDAIAP